MSSHLPAGRFPPDLDKGDYVALSSGEFRAAYDMFSAGVAGKLPFDPSFPTEYQHARTGVVTPLPDTPFNRAWFAAGKLFTDEARQISFGARIHRVVPIALDQKYAKYIDRRTNWFHIALMTAMASVRFSSKTTPKALRAALDLEFRRQARSHGGASHDAPFDNTTAAKANQTFTAKAPRKVDRQ